MEVEKYKKIALRILSPIKQIDDKTIASRNFLLSGRRSEASSLLTNYYLVYILFSELLNFKNLGKFEKIAWSFPIDYNGKVFLIEDRKLGLGIFIQDLDSDEDDAFEIVKKINKAIKNIRPFFDSFAEEAVKNSKLNVVNNNKQLFERFSYLLKLYKEEYKGFLENKGKREETIKKTVYGEAILSRALDFEFKQRANWLAISCIEAFFSWTEHLFIHLAVIYQGIGNGEEISTLIGSEWKTKFKAAIPIDSSKEIEQFYNELITVRNQLRNFVAHGAFGKDGNAFQFHSKTGAIPVLMDHKRKRNKFFLHGYLTFQEQKVIELIEDFIKFLWKSETKTAMIYTQGYGLPTILPYASDGVYAVAIESEENMNSFANKIMRDIDDYKNMDW